MTDPGPSTQEEEVSSALSARQFWDRYKGEVGPVCAFLVRLGVPSRDVEDVAHDAFVIACQRLATFDARRPIRPWLFGIAIRVAKARGRRAYASREVARELPDVADAARGPDESAQDRQAQEILAHALDTLDENQRAVFVLHEIEQEPIPRIAEALAIPVNTAYSRLRLARQKLNDLFSAHREVS